MGAGQTLFGQMQTSQKFPLILTLKLDEQSQAFFDGQRKLYFPPERNFLNAHCTLFHQLPDTPKTFQIITDQKLPFINLQVTGLMNLGAGVAYRLEAPQLMAFHQQLSLLFKNDLIAQESQGFRPHIVIQNKVSPEAARLLLNKLSAEFEPFSATGIGLQLWRYLGGPWEMLNQFDFNQAYRRA